MPNRDISSAQLSSVKEDKKKEEEEEGVLCCELAELHDHAEEKSYKCPGSIPTPTSPGRNMDGVLLIVTTRTKEVVT